MSKFLILNICIALSCMMLMAMTTFKSHTCSVKDLGSPKHKVWKATEPTIKYAYINAQALCEKNSTTPEKCLIMDCE